MKGLFLDVSITITQWDFCAEFYFEVRTSVVNVNVSMLVEYCMKAAILIKSQLQKYVALTSALKTPLKCTVFIARCTHSTQ